MKFTCESCSAQYMISDEKVGPSGVKVRCKKCGHVIVVRRSAPASEAPRADAEGADVASRAAAAGVAADTAVAAPPRQGGFEAELGEALDNAFREGAAPAAQAPAAAQDPAPTSAPADGASKPNGAAGQLMGSEDAGKPFADKPSGPAATEWYVAIGQAQVGPLPLAEVKRKWEGGDVGPDSLVWRPGMGDWSPLSTVTELAEYLSPVPRPSAQPARPAEPRPETPGKVEPAAPAPAEPSWKPVGASALAALASEEIAARTAPEPAPAPKSAKSLVDALPDAGGVDPTGALPLNIKALETITGEKKLERRSNLAREQARQRRTTGRAVVIGVVVGVLVVAGAAAGAYLYLRESPPARGRLAAAAPAPAPAPVQPAAPVAPATAPPAAAPGAVSAATPPAAQPPAAAPPAAAAPAPAKPEPPPAKEAVAQKEPPAAAPPEKAEPARHAARVRGKGKAAKAEPAPRHETARVAKAEPPPAPPPPPKKGRSGSLLDFESNDRALDDALGGSKPAGGRSVYVPPAPSTGSALPARVSAGDINAAVAQRIDSLRRCVSEQKAREPDATGTLKMRWVIQGDGSVADVKCLTREYAQGAFAQCISGVVKGIKFPRSQTTGQEVTFPFNF